jgi:aryl-alcohol dehydrogenase-like predicted oxidoreductase
MNGIPADSRGKLKGYEWLTKQLTNAEANAKIKNLMGIADELGCTMAQLAIAWCLKNPNVSTVITGASRVSQVTENMKSLDVVSKLTDDVIQKIEAVLGNDPNKEDEDD